MAGRLQIARQQGRKRYGTCYGPKGQCKGGKWEEQKRAAEHKKEFGRKLEQQITES